MHELVIEGVIGDVWADVSAADVRKALKDMKGGVSVYINSVGGSVFEGLAMLNQLQRYDRGELTVYVDGLAASAASVVAMGGDRVLMGTGSQMMIHGPWTVTVGDQIEHERAAQALAKARDSILDAYGRRVSDREQLGEWVDAETWFGAQDAVDAGLADGIEGDGVAAAIVPAAMYRHTPAALVAKDAAPVAAKAWRAVTMGMQLEIAKRR